MSIGSDIRDKTGLLEDLSHRPLTSFSSDAIPYVLSTVDAAIILISSLMGGVGYQLLVGNRMPNLLPYCAVGLLAGLLYVLRMKGSGHYDFPDSARPRVEIGEILVCWLTTGLLLAFLAFLLKIGVAYSRGAFVVFYFLAPIGLLSVRKLTKIVLSAAVSRGAVGRRDIVLVGEIDEIGVLGPQDRLSLFGAAAVN